ncbi:MAG TPA: hypothetical protein VK699_14305 [Terriglobales bacterium]|jgi:hypothetical protein|nr:hypothetical protein [Terriglobales bacterium]
MGYHAVAPSTLWRAEGGLAQPGVFWHLRSFFSQCRLSNPLERSAMSHDAVVSKALQELREHIGQEQDPNKLRDLVIEINTLLDIIERQVAKIEEAPSA